MIIPASQTVSTDADDQNTIENDWFDIGGNKLKLVHLPNDRLEALLTLIEQARHSLKLFFYMFEGDDVGRLVLRKLIEACRRGVRVELMVDSFGSNGAPKGFFDNFEQAGGHFAIFSPRFSTSYFVRNHQKFIISDHDCAMIGGFNIANQYFDQHSQDQDSENNETSWTDLGVVIHGPEVRKLEAYYEQLSDWVCNNNGNIRSLQKMVRRWEAGNGNFRWLLGGPSNRLSRWAWSIKGDLEKGEQLDLVSAYFSPGQGLLRRIARLSKRGGKNRLILAGKTDNAATIGASRLLYGYLLKRSTCIYEYQRKRLHMKLVIIDDAVYIGSANFDLRSLFINVEMMVRIEDKAFANHARAIVDDMCQASLPISKELHKARKGLLNRLRWTLSYFVVNVLDYTVTRRFNFGVKK
ncbi:phospholipase D-like domain-containing protein [Parasphingorhabdus cellanae]|uniref:Phospholipase D n=1 Tax=Parasphingorhabdus cellanae TaxID=2806553 RepID=A0ABX7T666_9SPHN|nr:phosphatidylserine/phosphatidylglycerophosphate/cardiolipin synthase family protein [Parasphingorhabdus cellanae]QTD57016.1 phosphatidylserine/phosphatidylglycerophosphate/cardiolipin synthase family protein [Parasphingorhabdus cellanae]